MNNTAKEAIWADEEDQQQAKNKAVDQLYISTKSQKSVFIS